MADHVLRNLQPEAIPRLQQAAIALLAQLHQPLSNRTIRGLAEITALRVLEMRAPRQQRDLDVGDRRAREHAQMLAFPEMLHDQPLPIAVEHILAAYGRIPHAAALGKRLQQHVGLRIVPQRLEMPHALDRRGDRLLIQDASRTERHVKPEPVVQHLLDDFQLHRAHQMHMRLLQPWLPDDVEQRVLVLKLPQRHQALVRITLPRQQRVCEHRL